jgi:hypothetical protein
MEFLFLLAFGKEEFFIAFAMACSETFFNKLLIGLCAKPNRLVPLLTRQVRPLIPAQVRCAAEFLLRHELTDFVTLQFGHRLRS